MRKVLLAFAMLLCINCVAYAQSLSEIFKGNESMESIFVNPLGITDAVDDTDMGSLVSKVSQLGLTYNIQPLGPFGEAMTVEAADFKVGGIDLAQLVILVNNEINMIFFTTSPSDAYRDFSSYLEKNLSEYKVNKDSSKNGISNYKLYMLSDKYGIAVGDIPERKTATAILMDMRNLKRFVEMGSLFPY